MSRTRSFLAALVLMLLTESTVRADLRCDEKQFNVGEVKAGRPLSHRFTLINHGPENVDVTAVQPGCGCLQPHLAERHLRPGDTGVLVIDVNTLTSAAGPNAWRVQVFYSAGEKRCDLT